MSWEIDLWKAIERWREKADFLQSHEAIAADPPQKFTLKRQIEEAEGNIEELATEPMYERMRSHRDSRSQVNTHRELAFGAVN
ncbi:MAG: hypothetical protein WD049_04390 [Candidatus Paceibacterota bacterium]